MLTSPYYIAMAIMAAAISALIAFRILKGRKDPFLSAFALISIFFCYGLMEQEYSRDVPWLVLALAHTFWISFFVVVLFSARPLRPNQLNRLLIPIKAISPALLFWVCFVWILWKFILLVQYGPNIFAFTRAVFSEDALSPLSWWEAMLSSFLGLLLLGSFIVMVIRQAIGLRSPWPLWVIICMVFVIYFLTGESPVGARRLLFGLAALWFATNWVVKKRSLTVKKSITIVAIGLIVVVGAFYFQMVRFNVGNPEVAQYLKSNKVSDFILGFALFLIPVEDVYGGQIKVLRSGPFDFFAKVVERVLVDGRSTRGEATWFSLELTIPRLLYPGEKPVGDVDNILAWNLKIYPESFFSPLWPDYPTSLEAIGFSDAGVIGLFLLAIGNGLFFWLTKGVIAQTRKTPILCLALLAMMMTLIAGKEISLTGLLASARDIVLLAGLYLPLHLVFVSIRQGVRIPRTPGGWEVRR